MASRMALFLLFNILFFTMVVASNYNVPCPPPPKPKPKPKPSSSGGGGCYSCGHDPAPYPNKCPMDTLKLGVCANVLGLVHLVIGNPPKNDCCPLIVNLADLEAAICLCTAIKADVLGINLDVHVTLTLLLNYCGKKVPQNFQCPN